MPSGLRSKLEERIDKQIRDAGLESNYESIVLKYIVPARPARYTPDFRIPKASGGDLIIEAKGRFRSAQERQKMLLVRDQTNADIRLVFQNADLPIYKGSPTPHAKWAATNGFLYADKGVVPESWLQEAKQCSLGWET